MRPVLLSIAFMISASQALAAGEGAGRGGADYQNPNAGTAWFLGSRAIRYCLESSADFGVTAQDLDREIQKAFAHWTEYVRAKKVNEKRDPNLALVMNLAPRIACDGTEDLKFYFGSTSSDVVAVKDEFSNPVAFAYRNDYDFEKGWAKGKSFIWLAPPKSVDPATSFPDWTKPGAVSVALLHEVGHVFGNADVPGTIMAPDLAETLKLQDSVGGSVFTERQAWLKRQMIDGEVELYSCEQCPYVGIISDDPKATAETFRRLVGRDPVGTVRAQVANQSGGTVVTLGDSKGDKPLKISPMGDYSYFSSGVANILSVSHFSPAQGITGGRMGRHLEVGVTHGKLRSGLNSYLIEVTFNLRTDAGSSPAQVFYFDGNSMKPLFKWVPQL